MPKRKAKTKRREARSHTVRVSAECHRCICLISRGLDRSKAWVVEHAVADYAIIRDLDETAQLRRPKMEVR
jgi:predicted transcriptional regulator